MHEAMTRDRADARARAGVAALVALTPAARDAMGREYLVLDRLPFRVGRESRRDAATAAAAEERRGFGRPANDLYITEGRPGGWVSREHFSIERSESGFVLVDRGSRTGTLVAGRSVAGQGGRVPLHDQDVIIVGPIDSPFVFRFRCD